MGTRGSLLGGIATGA